MKKLIIPLLALLLLTACSRKPPETGNADPPTSGTAQTQEPDGTGGAEPVKVYEGPDAYWEELRDRWLAEKNEGFVWTITIDEATVLDAKGLAEATYDLDLSCSHVGKEMTGVYCGSLAMSYGADLTGLTERFPFMSAFIPDTSTDGWFRSDSFVMELAPYSAEEDEAFAGTLGGDDADGDDALGSLLGEIGSGNRPFEESETPAALWYDWDSRMTEGDMESMDALTELIGMATGSGTPIGGRPAPLPPLDSVYEERYGGDFDAPFPYVIRVYDTGEAVFELHSPAGGPVVVKFYGTIDSVPVSETAVVKIP